MMCMGVLWEGVVGMSTIGDAWADSRCEAASDGVRVVARLATGYELRLGAVGGVEEFDLHGCASGR